MRAILMTATGGPEVLALGEVATPTPARDHDLLVRLYAAGVNPVDTKLRSRGTYFPDRTPTILGCDGAGVVEAVGAAVSRFAPGDEVYFCSGGLGGPLGNYGEYIVVDERHVARKPAALSFVEAAAVPLALITAWESLHDRAGMQRGQRVLVHGGAGGVGHIAIQLAKAAGCAVVTTVSSAQKTEFVRALGADEVIDYRETDFVEAINAWTGGSGVDVGFDTVGGEVFERTFRTIRPYGELVTLLQPADVDWKHARLRNLRVSLELMLSPMVFGWVEARRHQAWILEQGAQYLDSGRLKVHVSDVLPLERAAEAHRRIEEGGMEGKLVLTI